jgi:hypothetical protein
MRFFHCHFRPGIRSPHRVLAAPSRESEWKGGATNGKAYFLSKKKIRKTTSSQIAKHGEAVLHKAHLVPAARFTSSAGRWQQSDLTSARAVLPGLRSEFLFCPFLTPCPIDNFLWKSGI